MRSSKNYSEAEIAAKLAQANDLAAQGKLQSEIAKTLGVSVMTLYRWRKLPVKGSGESKTPAQQELSHGQRIADIQLENARLRRLVTDLLLEKMKLEETVQGSLSPGRTAKRRADR
jgi:putative transposase